jgi:hypothetical protein
MTLRDLPFSSRDEVSKKETVKQNCHREPKHFFLRSLLPFSVRKWSTIARSGSAGLHAEASKAIETLEKHVRRRHCLLSTDPNDIEYLAEWQKCHSLALVSLKTGPKQAALAPRQSGPAGFATRSSVNDRHDGDFFDA